MNYQGTALAAISDDTVELQLSAEDLLGLSQASEAALLTGPDTSPAHSPPPPQIDLPHYGAAPYREGPKTSVGGMLSSMAAFLAFAVFVWWSVDHLFGQPPAPAVAAISRSSIIARPAMAATPAPSTSTRQQSVLVKNPFDRTEVFEFPPGTSKEESRQKVAELLLHRARERRNQWAGTKPAENLRAANFYRAP